MIVTYKTQKIVKNGNFGQKEKAIGQLLYSNGDQICDWSNEKLLEWLKEHRTKVPLDVGPIDCFEIIEDV